MTITLAQINQVILRTVFKPWAEQNLREIGVALPIPWEPTDAELERLAETFSRACREFEELE